MNTGFFIGAFVCAFSFAAGMIIEHYFARWVEARKSRRYWKEFHKPRPKLPIQGVARPLPGPLVKGEISEAWSLEKDKDE